MVGLLLRVLSIALFVIATNAAECPRETPDWGSEKNDPQEPASLQVVNRSPLPIYIYWVDFEGHISPTQRWGPNPVQRREQISTFARHHFRIYGLLTSSHNDQTPDEILLLEHTVEKAGDETLVVLGDCDEAIAAQAKMQSHQKNVIEETKDVAEEMKSLVHNQQAPCEPAEDSSRWSCIQHISKQDYEERLSKHSGTLYGFNSTEEAGERKIGDTVDLVHQGNIPFIPRVADGPGFLKMSFTEKMKEALYPFYQDHQRGGPQDAEAMHHPIQGGFTNSHVVQMSIIELDSFPQVRQTVSDEIQRILEWWTQQNLVPTSTFGIRNYHHGSMLINHVDRADTHLASAVIQVAQDGVEQGWPLEVLHPDGSCSEVYLQPGELVLYEGARFQHGRPMRFNGTSFANIFSHFRPEDWFGPGESPKYDGLLDQDGFLKTSRSIKDSNADDEL